MTDYLLIAHHDDHPLSLVDTESLQDVQKFDTLGRTAVLGASSSGRYGFAVHRDDHCVTIIDGRTASVVAIGPTEEQPTHFHAYNDQIVIFNDGSGSVSVFNEKALDQPPQVIRATQPDHGSAVMIDDYLLAGHLRLGRVDIYRAGQPEMVQSFDCCPVLHGATQVGSTALFGCADGVLLLKKRGEQFDAIKLDNPSDAPPRTRVGVFATHPKSQIVLGNFGHGVAAIDVDQAMMQVIQLPAYPLKFSFDANGKTIIVLTNEGLLHRLSLPSGEIIASKPITSAVEPPKGPDGKARPTFTLGNNLIYIVEPEGNRLIEVAYPQMTRQRTLGLSHKPSSLIYLRNVARV